ncbi:MAG: hypothetical protein ACR2PS_00255 [Pseudomonadales bacterium]
MVVYEFSEEKQARLAEWKARQKAIEENPAFDDVKNLWPSIYRGNVRVAQEKWDEITGEGLQTRVLDRDTGSYHDVFLKATPQEIYRGAKEYTRDYKEKDGDLQYAKRFQNFLNGGLWIR